MSTLSVTLPDGSSRELAQGATALDLAKSIGSGLAKAAVAAVVDGVETDIISFNDWVDDDDDFDGCRAQDVRIIANDTAATLYGFDTSRPPYRFLDWSEEVERNFLDWFVNFINSSVIHYHNLFSETGIKLKDLK